MTITKQKKWCTSIPQRYVIALMCFFGLFNAFSLRSCLSIAITEMVGPSSKTAIADDNTCSYDDIVATENSNIGKESDSHKNATKEIYNWSEHTQGLILSSFYWGYIFTHLPGSYIAEKYGGKHTFGFGILSATILTILTPAAVYIGDATALIILRLLMGLGEGVTFPAANVLLAKWAPSEERSRIGTFVFASVMIGTVFATILSGWILQYSSMGWPLVFYVTGAISIVWYLLWLILCYSSPQDHPFITQEELLVYLRFLWIFRAISLLIMLTLISSMFINLSDRVSHTIVQKKILPMNLSRGQKKCCTSIPQRYVIALLCFFGLFNAYSLRSCLSIAITEMVCPPTKAATVDDITCTYDDIMNNKISSISKAVVNHKNTTREIYDWNEYTQGLILSSFYWSYALTHLPGSYMAEKYGGKHTFGFGILIATVLTILTPAAVYIGDSTALIILRVIMGLGEGVTYPAVNVLLAKWAPPEERSRIASFVHASIMIGTVFATIVSGWILQYSSWPLVFYVIGAISILWYLMWLIFCYNSPQDHPFITQEEVNYLDERMKEHTHENPPAVPWRHILTSKPVWATTVAMIGSGWMTLSIVTDLPKYMSNVLKLSVENNGYLSSLVYICTWISGTTTPWLADYLISKKNVSTTLVRKIFSVAGMTIAATFVIGASYAGCDRALVIAMFVVSTTLSGCAYPSFLINPLDLSPNYAGPVTVLANGIAVLTGFVGPYIIGVLAPNQTLTEWRLVFWIMFAVVIICNLVFLVYGSGEVEYWNDPEFVRATIEDKDKRKIDETKI